MEYAQYEACDTATNVAGNVYACNSCDKRINNNKNDKIQKNVDERLSIMKITNDLSA